MNRRQEFMKKLKKIHIFDTILSENPKLDPERDKEELYHIMINDERIKDLDNLITYCKDCHLHKIHGYKKKNLC